MDRSSLFVVILLSRFPQPNAPIIWFPLLHKATQEQRQRYEIGGGGVSLHWPELDEDISIANLMAGVNWESA